jgi:glycosyltransferase involved in cell wall biosynthesis
MQQRRIVLAMVEPPLPFGNAAARWYYVLLKGLVERGHRVSAFAACSKAEEIDKARALFPQPEFDLRLYPFPAAKKGWTNRLQTVKRPYSFMFSPELKRDLEAELARGYDVLHLEQLWSGWLGIGHEARSLVNVHHLVWIDLGGLDDPGAVPHAVKLRERLQNQLMFWAERRLVRSHRHFRSCSPRLVDPMKRVNPAADITTVPVGIDPDRYAFIPDERRSQTATLSLIGSMAWYPGYSAAVRLLTRLWPEIKRRVPHARLEIVGWSARSALKEFLNAPGVEIAENVPDTQPYFDRTNVLLYAPSRGSGMKIKILEAMAFGVPVVTTSEGVEGIPAQDGVHAGVCEDDAGLIERTVALLEDPDRQNRQRHAARALLESHCGPKPTLDAIESIYTRMLEAAR